MATLGAYFWADVDLVQDIYKVYRISLQGVLQDVIKLLQKLNVPIVTSSRKPGGVISPT